MNLIEKWKNRETKKKLREENIRLTEKNKNLEEQLSRIFTINLPRPTNIIREERNIHKLISKYLVRKGEVYERDMPVEYIKREIASNMLTELEHTIEYDFYDIDSGRVYTGMLWAVTGDKKHECS